MVHTFFVIKIVTASSFTIIRTSQIKRKKIEGWVFLFLPILFGYSGSFKQSLILFITIIMISYANHNKSIIPRKNNEENEMQSVPLATIYSSRIYLL